MSCRRTPGKRDEPACRVWLIPRGVRVRKITEFVPWILWVCPSGALAEANARVEVCWRLSLRVVAAVAPGHWPQLMTRS